MTFLINRINISEEEEEDELVGKPEVESARPEVVVSLPETALISEETVVPDEPKRFSLPELPDSSVS